MSRFMTRKYTPLALVVLLGACGHLPAPPPAPAPVALTDANGNPIPPRPHIFGRHAWDLQYGDAARQAETRAQTPAQAQAPAAPAPVVAVAPPPSPAPAPQQAAPVPEAQSAPPPVTPPPPVQMAVAPPPQPVPQVAVPMSELQPAPPPPASPPVQLAAAPPPPPVPQVAVPMSELEPAPPPAPVTPPPTPKPAAAAPAPANGPLAFWKHLTRPDAPPVVGGYQAASDMKAVRAAADFAVHASPFYELKGIYSAKTQVVAGTNYSLCLWVRQKEHEANPLHRRMVATTVFQGLDGHYELTSWQEVNVCHAGT